MRTTAGSMPRRHQATPIPTAQKSRSGDSRTRAAGSRRSRARRSSLAGKQREAAEVRAAPGPVALEADVGGAEHARLDEGEAVRRNVVVKQAWHVPHRPRGRERRSVVVVVGAPPVVGGRALVVAAFGREINA